MFCQSFSVISRYQLQKCFYFSNLSKLTEKNSTKKKLTSESNKNEKDWPKEVDGPKGPEPTRYGDWERKGRVSDF